jgi:hypothetical protein
MEAKFIRHTGEIYLWKSSLLHIAQHNPLHMINAEDR